MFQTPDSTQWDGHWRNVRIPTLPRALNPAAHHTRRFLGAAAREAGPRVCELGCAPGGWLARLALDAGVRVTGCDFSELGAELTRKNFEALGVEGTVHCKDLFSMGPEEAGEHDLVYSLGLVEHFEDTPRILRAHARLARAGGLVAVSVPNLHGLAGLPFRRLNPDIEASHQILTVERLREAAQQAGLVPLFCRYAGPWSGYVFMDRLRRPLIRAAVYGACTLAALLTYPVRSRFLSGSLYLLAQNPGAAIVETLEGKERRQKVEKAMERA